MPVFVSEIAKRHIFGMFFFGKLPIAEYSPVSNQFYALYIEVHSI